VIAEAFDDEDEGDGHQHVFCKGFDVVGDPEVGHEIIGYGVEDRERANDAGSPEEVAVEAPVVLLGLQEFAVEDDIGNMAQTKYDVIEIAFEKEVEGCGGIMQDGFQEKEGTDTETVACVIEEFGFGGLEEFADTVEDHHEHDACEEVGDDVDVGLVLMVEVDAMRDKGVLCQAGVDGVGRASDKGQHGIEGAGVMGGEGDLSVAFAVGVVGQDIRKGGDGARTGGLSGVIPLGDMICPAIELDGVVVKAGTEIYGLWLGAAVCKGEQQRGFIVDLFGGDEMFVFFCTQDGKVEGRQLVGGDGPQIGKAEAGGGGDVVGHSDLGEIGEFGGGDGGGDLGMQFAD